MRVYACLLPLDGSVCFYGISLAFLLLRLFLQAFFHVQTARIRC